MISVAIQGIKGSYSEEAAMRLMGEDAVIVECVDFEQTFAALSEKRAAVAVIPVENKIVGRIAGTVSLLSSSGFRVLDQLPLEVRHVLAGTQDAEFAGIRNVQSHIEALKQCRRFFAENIQLSQIIGGDTAASVREIVGEDIRSNAAIGSRRAAELYGASVLRENIADDPDNWTTFYLIGI